MSNDNKEEANVYKISDKKPTNGFRQEKKMTRIEKLERAVKSVASLPQFLLEEFQKLRKVVQDIRFTYEIIGVILMEKNIISQEEINEVGKRLIEERKKANENKTETVVKGEVVEVINKDKALEELNNEKIKDEITNDLMKPNEDLQKEQVQDIDVSIKKIGD